MQRHKRENIEWLNFDLLSEVLEFSHGVLLRVGGYSASSYRSLNGSYDVGDDPENVTKNRDKVCALFGLSSLIFARQCHGVEVVPVVEHSLDLPPCDGLMTNRAKCALAVWIQNGERLPSCILDGVVLFQISMERRSYVLNRHMDANGRIF